MISSGRAPEHLLAVRSQLKPRKLLPKHRPRRRHFSCKKTAGCVCKLLRKHSHLEVGAPPGSRQQRTSGRRALSGPPAVASAQPRVRCTWPARPQPRRRAQLRAPAAVAAAARDRLGCVVAVAGTATAAGVAVAAARCRGGPVRLGRASGGWPVAAGRCVLAAVHVSVGGAAVAVGWGRVERSGGEGRQASRLHRQAEGRSRLHGGLNIADQPAQALIDVQLELGCRHLGRADRALQTAPGGVSMRASQS